MPVKIRRGQLGRVRGVDVTRGSGSGPIAGYLAPPWALVTGVKRGLITEGEYAATYLAQLEQVPTSIWERLAERAVDGLVTIVCYCPDGAFCHTYLVIDFACRRFPGLFVRA